MTNYRSYTTEELCRMSELEEGNELAKELAKRIYTLTGELADAAAILYDVTYQVNQL